MKKLILLFISFLMVSITGNAQDILDGAYDRKTTYENRKVQPYPHLRAADVMWARKIWREIDLREKINHPFEELTKKFSSPIINGYPRR